MSATLGPIHYWLYEKIRNQEDLTKVIAEYAKKEEWLTDISKYVYILPRLEDTIDEDNIHGWLQEKINDAEIRFSRLIIELLKNDENRIDEICTVAFEFGKKNAIQPDLTPTEAYQVFENFFVNGMPCDRINVLQFQSNNMVSWEMSEDIHAKYWDDSSSLYYIIRKNVMDGMLYGTGLILNMRNDYKYTIVR